MDASVFFEALALAEGVVASDAVARAWAAPSALAGYTVGGLCAHLVVAVERTASTVEAPPPDAADPGLRLLTLPGYYGLARVETPDDLDGAVHTRLRAAGEERAAQGPPAVVDAFRRLGGRLRPLLEATAPDRLVPVLLVPGGAVRVDDYLVSRVIELVVHADDLAASVGIDLPPVPAAVLDQVTGALVDLAVARSGAVAVLRAFTRAERADADVLRVL